MLSMGGERKETCAEVAAAVVEDRGNCKSVKSLRLKATTARKATLVISRYQSGNN